MITFTLNKKELLKAFTTLKPFMGKEATHYCLIGINIEWKNNTLTLVATDGHKMSFCGLEIIDVDESDAGVTSAIASADFVNLAIAAMKKDKGEFVMLSFNGQDTKIECLDHISVTSLCIDGKYPQWRDVIPEIKEDAVRVGMNQVQVSAACSVFKGANQSMEWTFNGDNAPVLIKPKDSNQTIVLMPHRI
jgi:DNA polymerase III subunit beta